MVGAVLAVHAGHALHIHRHHHARAHAAYTGFVIEGRDSTFGALTGDSEGQTADGGTTDRPCIATREGAIGDPFARPPIPDRRFRVTVRESPRGRMLGHPATLPHCDYGPAEWTGRNVDITGVGDEALGLSPGNFPTNSWAIARELR